MFAIIVAQSFMIATDLLIPLDEILNDDNFLKTTSLFLVYVIIISGWVGYARSMSEKPHKDNHHGILRFVIDLVILFEYFYLLQLTKHPGNFQDEFVWVISIIFWSYFIWDVIKYVEYRGKKVRNRIGVTLLFAIICLAISGVYYLTQTNEVIETDSTIVFIAYIANMLIIILGYRIVKWNTKNKKTSY